MRPLVRVPVLVDGNLFNVSTALDARLLLGNHVLHDNVSHVLAERVTLTVKTMDSGEHELVHGDRAIITANGNVVGAGTRRT